MRRMVVAGLLMVASSQLLAQQGRFVWEDFSKRIGASRQISPLGDDLFGDKVSLSNGALSFSIVDIDLPGNNALPVRFGRSYEVMNRRYYGNTGMLADWDVDVPSLSGVFATDWLISPGTDQPGSANRCSAAGYPPVVKPFRLEDYFHGIKIDIPGSYSGTVLRKGRNVPSPAHGTTYRWVGNDGQTQLSCLPSIKNGAGEGFLAITPDGTRYWFDWMAQVYEPAAKTIDDFNNRPTPVFLEKRRNILYATRVEDRHGNHVIYTYSNAWNAPGRLTSIQSSDGRALSIGWVGNFVGSVSDGVRTWTYSYGTTSSGRSTLTSVVQPDQSRWTIDFAPFTNAELIFRDFVPGGEVIRTCTLNELPTNFAEQPTGTLTHPSGATGTFVTEIREHGRSKVPLSCSNFSTPYNDPNDDINLWAIKAYSFTLKQKRIAGPGVPDAVWDYTYVPGTSIFRYPGTTTSRPICDWLNYNCALPPCLSDDCAGASTTLVTGPGGEWQRYTHGNTYLYNEGKLLKVETGAAGQPAMRIVVNQYDLSMQDQAYPARFGTSWGGGDGGFQQEYHRPLVAATTWQDGAAFVRLNEVFDHWARPVRVTRSSAPGSAPAAPSPVVEPPPTLTAPTLSAPEVAYVGQTFTLSWTSDPAASHYIVERRLGTGEFAAYYSGGATSTTAKVQVVTSFTARVKACDGSVCSPFSQQKVTSIRSSGGGGGGIEP